MKTALAALALTFSTATFAQQTARETIEVRVTNVDVVVTDRAGNPAVGLTADDFEILESGKPQKITNFYEVRELAPGIKTAALSAPAAADVATSATPAQAVPPTRRRLIVFVDNTSVDPHARTQMLDALQRSMNRVMREGDEAMLVLFDGVSANVIAPLTSDRALLIRRLGEVAGRSGGSLVAESQKNTIIENAQTLLNAAKNDPGDPDARDRTNEEGEESASRTGRPKAAVMSLTMSQAYSMALSAVQSFVEQAWRRQRSLLASMTSSIDAVAPAEGKKMMLFVGGELTENPGADLVQRINALFAAHVRAVQPTSLRDNSRSLSADLTTFAQRANAAGVTMYMVDASARRVPDASSGTIDRTEPETLTAADTPMAMKQVATMTGGLWVPAGNTIQAALDTIVRDVSAYYSLGYTSHGDGKAPVEVRVKRDGLRVRMRQAYTQGAVPALTATAAPAATAPDATNTPAVEELATPEDLVKKRVTANLFDVERSEFAVAVSASPREPQGNDRSQVVLTVTFPTSITMKEEEGSLKGNVEIYIVTSNEQGRTSKVASQTQELKFPSGTRSQVLAQKNFTMTFPMVVGSGNVKVSVAVADQLGGTIGFARTTIPQ